MSHLMVSPFEVAPYFHTDTTVDTGPESDVEAYDAIREAERESSEDDGEDEARSHARNNYYTPSSSNLRRKADFMEGADAEQRRRYEGIKTTRRELMDGSDENESDMDEVSQEDDLSIDEEASDTASIERESDKASSSAGRQDRIPKLKSNGNHAQTDARKRSVHFQKPMDNDQPLPDTTKSLNSAQSDAQLLQHLRSRTKEDAAKGRDARKQRATWAKLLGVRIRAQKVVRMGGRIPSQLMKESRSELTEADQQALGKTLESLDEITRHLFSLQQQVLQSFTKAETRENSVVSSALPPLQSLLDEVSQPRKRSIDDISDHDKHIEALLQLDQHIFDPLWRDVLSRWSSRTAASASEGVNRNKFQVSLKAMNQSAEDQIDRGLSGDAFDRLRKRTRVWRGNEDEARLDTGTKVASNTQAEEDSDNEEISVNANADIFDDSDFYSALLRELIDSRGASSEMGVGLDVPDSSLLWAQAAKKAAKKNKNGEMKSSKGRKLRYDVIEKVEHFMPPVPRETWSKEQIDRLFLQIKGADHNTQDINGEGDEIARLNIGEEGEGLGGLRLL